MKKVKIDMYVYMNLSRKDNECFSKILSYISLIIWSSRTWNLMSTKKTVGY